jgi:hypothetical protein
MIKSISITLVRGTKNESTASWESLYVGLKQGDFISGTTDFSFESEEVTGSLFNEEEVEQTVNNAYQIHKKHCFSLSNQEWLLWISSGHIKECMSSFD